MKKFVFTLQTLFEYKQAVERQQKADLSEANAVLRALLEEEQRLQQAFEQNAASLDRALKKQENVIDALEKHDAYFRYLREARAELQIKIQKAEEVKERCQMLLIGTMKEIKTYEKLKEEQHLHYLEDLRREEAKDIGDLVSFQAITGGA